ncbi:hypothetical protein SAMN04488117_10927 [Celeribacter baekdonensis]|uniref:Uncharacterized protein n=1 Tax=Celeribacter baekdonensis TaxID=875171 RepID=A0A1G7Q989_9RHOB|nr:hypothetical protein [Celeribacter baekdonensis]SDF94150.1 hypothetical protein SAMN04488117_10927 [Celeribacter baekdonensis]
MFDLAIGPRMVWLGQAVRDLTCLADHVEPHLLTLFVELWQHPVYKLAAFFRRPGQSEFTSPAFPENRYALFLMINSMFHGPTTGDMVGR